MRCINGYAENSSRRSILTRHPTGATLPLLGRDFRNRLFFATDGILEENSNKSKANSSSIDRSKSVSSPSLVREGGPRQRWVSSLCDAKNGNAQTRRGHSRCTSVRIPLSKIPPKNASRIFEGAWGNFAVAEGIPTFSHGENSLQKSFPTQPCKFHTNRI